MSAALLHVTTLGKLFTHICFCSPISINLYRPFGGDAQCQSVAGKVTVGLTSHSRTGHASQPQCMVYPLTRGSMAWDGLARNGVTLCNMCYYFHLNGLGSPLVKCPRVRILIFGAILLFCIARFPLPELTARVNGPS